MEEGDSDVCSQAVMTEPADGTWPSRLDWRSVVYIWRGGISLANMGLFLKEHKILLDLSSLSCKSNIFILNFFSWSSSYISYYSFPCIPPKPLSDASKPHASLPT